MEFQNKELIQTKQDLAKKVEEFHEVNLQLQLSEDKYKKLVNYSRITSYNVCYTKLLRFKKLYDTYFDEEQQKGRPISELVIPQEIKEKGEEAVNEFVSEKRLAYYDNAQVWWCDSCKTVCANEEVLTDGSHEKCGNTVVRKNLKQS